MRGFVSALPRRHGDDEPVLTHERTTTRSRSREADHARPSPPRRAGSPTGGCAPATGAGSTRPGNLRLRAAPGRLDRR